VTVRHFIFIESLAYIYRISSGIRLVHSPSRCFQHFLVVLLNWTERVNGSFRLECEVVDSRLQNKWENGAMEKARRYIQNVCKLLN